MTNSEQEKGTYSDSSKNSVIMRLVPGNKSLQDSGTSAKSDGDEIERKRLLGIDLSNLHHANLIDLRTFSTSLGPIVIETNIELFTGRNKDQGVVVSKRRTKLFPLWYPFRRTVTRAQQKYSCDHRTQREA